MRIGLIVEGGIDEEIIPPLLDQLRKEAAPLFSRPLEFHPMPYQPHGAGEVPKVLRILIKLHDTTEWQRLGCDAIVAVIDSRKTDVVQAQIRQVLHSASGFPAVYALAIQEVEAWVLGDIENVNRYVFKIQPPPRLTAKPEQDSDPKKTLTDKFVLASNAIDYDDWNRNCANLVAGYLRHSEVRTNCPKGFGRLARDFVQVARRTP